MQNSVLQRSHRTGTSVSAFQERNAVFSVTASPLYHFLLFVSSFPRSFQSFLYWRIPLALMFVFVFGGGGRGGVGQFSLSVSRRGVVLFSKAI